MEIKIVFDKNALSNRYSIGWGISYLVDNSILFDTGEDWKYLVNNFRIMKIDISKINIVVISHDHWDHTNGLWELLKLRKGIEVVTCHGFGKEFRNKVNKFQGKLKEVKRFNKLSENIYTTGEIPGEYKSKYMPEQALVLKTGNGISVLTGCAHPGIVDMLYLVKKHFSNEKMYFAGGGFHLAGQSEQAIQSIVDEFKKAGIKKAGPTHCSGIDAETIFRKSYGTNFIQIKAGQIFEI